MTSDLRDEDNDVAASRLGRGHLIKKKYLQERQRRQRWKGMSRRRIIINSRKVRDGDERECCVGREMVKRRKRMRREQEVWMRRSRNVRGTLGVRW